MNQGVYTQDFSVDNVVSNLAVNTDDFFVDIENSRVGIGKTEPTVALDVVGDVTASGALTVSSNTAVNTDDLFVDTVNSRVGIGKTEPTVALDVVGAVTASGDLTVTGTSKVGIGTDTLDAVLNVGSGALASGDQILKLNTDSPWAFEHETNGLALRSSAATKKFYVQSSDFSNVATFEAVDGGASKVGIGLTDPASKLHVMGDIIGRNVSNTHTIEGTDGGSDTFTLLPDQNRILIQHSGSTTADGAYTVNMTGGIPTTIGSILYLEIESSKVNADLSSAHTHSTTFQIEAATYLTTGSITVTAANTAGDVYERTLRRTIILTSGGWKDYSVYPKLSVPTTDDAIIFSTTENATQATEGEDKPLVERLRITGNGNVGIGTASPDKKVHIYTTASESNSQLFLESADRYASMQMLDDSGGVLVQNDQGDLRLLTGYDASMANGIETMRIKGSGNVGIGTNDPGLFKLNVNGTAHLPSIHRTNFTKELSEYFELVSGTTSTVTLNSRLIEINVTGTSDVDMSEYAGTIDLDIIAQRTNSSYGMDIVKTQLHFTAAWNEQSDVWQVLEFNQENKAVNINSYRCITSVPVFRYTYIDRKLQIYIQYNALQYRVKHSFTARVSSDEGFAGDIISYPGGGPMSGTDTVAVQGVSYGLGGKVGIGRNDPISRFNVKQSADNSPGGSFIISPVSGSLGYWGMYVTAGNDFMFHRNGGDRGYFDGDVNVTAIDFTGQHRNFIDGVPYEEYGSLEGLIVSANKNKYYDIDENVTTGANAIQISQSLPLVALSNVVHDKACFGVISGVEDPETREYAQGSFVSVVQKQAGDRRAYINSVGEGAIWVTNINGNLESGDYITTSNVAGYGQKQDSEFLANYTVAKITMDCNFDPVTQPIQIIRKEMSNVNYWVNTTYENVSEEEYSNLTEENRRTITETVYTNEDGAIFPEQNEEFTYVELEQTTYQKITNEESKTEQEGWELEVRQEPVNVLDEHGQIQWEDDPSGATEKAYKIRYLGADGNITDEANHVYKAAFVGCTYHCG